MTTSVPFGFTCLPEPVGFVVGFVVGCEVGAAVVSGRPAEIVAEGDVEADGASVETVVATDATDGIAVTAVVATGSSGCDVETEARLARIAIAERPMSRATVSNPATANMPPRRRGGTSTGVGVSSDAL